MSDDYFVIRRPDGAIEYEPREGRAPSARLRELWAEHGPEVKLGMTTTLPPHVRDIVGVEIKVGNMVRLRAYGTGYIGRVTWVGRKNAKVRITLARGDEKIITRSLSDLTLVQI